MVAERRVLRTTFKSVLEPGWTAYRYLAHLRIPIQRYE